MNIYLSLNNNLKIQIIGSNNFLYVIFVDFILTRSVKTVGTYKLCGFETCYSVLDSALECGYRLIGIIFESIKE